MDDDAENEDKLAVELQNARAQLAMVEQHIAVAGETEDLQSLASDLKELITLREENLLSLKKKKLLQALEHVESSSAQIPPAQTPPPPPHVASIDDEYAMFQAALQDDLATGQEKNSKSTAEDNYASQPSTSQHSGLPLPADSVVAADAGLSDRNSSSSSDSEDENSVFKGGISLDEELSKLVGMKCSAPFSHEWGKLDYHNALLVSAVRESQTDKILVKVMFTTPTHRAMLPCKYFLEGHCRFNEDKCKFSHGWTVGLEELREFVEADHSLIAVDSKCLARYSDDIWYPATVTDVKEDMVSVHFDDYGEHLEVSMAEVMPSVLHDKEATSDSEEDNEEAAKPGAGVGHRKPGVADWEEEEEEEELPVYLWQPPQTTAALGEWEIHTRGIGSKLMGKMGYIPGQGLGVHGQGKAEPVPIMLLPQGKSLDRIMELKEMAGKEDLFDAMKRLERQKRKVESKQADTGSRPTTSFTPGVFDFINSQLAGKKGDLSSLTKSKGHNPRSSSSGGRKPEEGSGGRHISEHQLHKKTDKDINLQVFKTHEEMRNVERQIDRLKEQLARNENKDRKMAAQVREKLEQHEAYLSQLRSSSCALEKHQKRRSDSKKLSVF